MAWNFAPGSAQGRIEPAGTTPPDGDHVFALGYDGASPEVALATGDGASVAQDIDVTGVNLLRLALHFKVPETLPVGREYLAGVGLATARLVPSGPINLLTIPAAQVQFGQGERFRDLLVTGSGAGNNGTRRVTAVLPPTSPGGPQRLLVDRAFAATETNAFAVTVPGYAWEAVLSLDGVTVTRMRLDAKRSRRRFDMAVNVSKLAGLHRFAARVALVQV